MDEKKRQAFTIQKRLLSFKYAWEGLKILCCEEHNARIHIAIAFFVILMGVFFNITASEWIVICMTIAIVIAMELVNSAIENLCDLVSPQYNHLIKKAKDLSAAAVLVTSVASIIVGLIIFLPKILH
ncbi:MAG: hypothetical protein RL662_1036 [Bacteroidota bacterium]|jgi:diacylglycerol kinase